MSESDGDRRFLASLYGPLTAVLLGFLLLDLVVFLLWAGGAFGYPQRALEDAFETTTPPKPRPRYTPRSPRRLVTQEQVLKAPRTEPAVSPRYYRPTPRRVGILTRETPFSIRLPTGAPARLTIRDLWFVRDAWLNVKVRFHAGEVPLHLHPANLLVVWETGNDYKSPKFVSDHGPVDIPRGRTADVTYSFFLEGQNAMQNVIIALRSSESRILRTKIFINRPR